MLKRLNNIDLKRVALISTTLFALMKICYWLIGDYTSEYWYVVYYLPLYFMLTSLFLLIRSYMVLKEYRLYFLFWACYFGAMMLFHVACLFDITLYGKFVSGVGYYGIGALIFTIGFTFLFIKLRSHGRRKTKGHNFNRHG